MTNDITEVKFHYIGKGTIKWIKVTLILIEDFLDGVSINFYSKPKIANNLQDLLYKIMREKMFRFAPIF